jgi:outer membrane protein TolC
LDFNFNKISALLLLISSALLASSCNTSSSIAAAVGHFEGFEVVQVGSTSTQYSVSAEVSEISNSSLKVVINTEPVTQPITFEVDVDSSGSVQFKSLSGYFAGSIALSHSTGNCFASSKASNPPASELCMSGNEIQASLPSTYSKFILDKMSPRPLPSMEPPKNYSVDALVLLAKSQSFATQAAFEAMVQAKLTAKQAEMNLLPHININSALGVESLSITTMLRSIGDLVPFFLPNHWFNMIALKDQSNAEIDAFKIVQAGAINIAHGLALSVLRDEEALRALQSNEVSIIQIRDQVVASELQGSAVLPLGSEANINILLDTLDKSINTLQEAINEEKVSLSQACGFFNPQAIDQVLSVALTPITGPLPGVLTDLENQATSRSLQLSQTDELILAAKKTKGEKEYEWLDPSGDDNGSIGFGYVDHIKIQDNQIDQLSITRSTTQENILAQVSDALTQSGTLYNTYQDDENSSQQAQQSINLYLTQFQNGQPFDMGSFATVLGQKTDEDVAQVDDIYAYLTLKDQMDFLTFSGAYADLIGETP